MLSAVIDFQNPVDTSSGPVFREFGRPGRWIALPHALDVGRRIDRSSRLPHRPDPRARGGDR